MFLDRKSMPWLMSLFEVWWLQILIFFLHFFYISFHDGKGFHPPLVQIQSSCCSMDSGASKVTNTRFSRALTMLRNLELLRAEGWNLELLRMLGGWSLNESAKWKTKGSIENQGTLAQAALRRAKR
jgi:hypothetical protein